MEKGRGEGIGKDCADKYILGSPRKVYQAPGGKFGNTAWIDWSA